MQVKAELTFSSEKRIIKPMRVANHPQQITDEGRQKCFDRPSTSEGIKRTMA